MSSPYYSATNNLAEVFNKTIVKILKKIVSSNQHGWDERLGECLWAYQTTARTPAKTMPFSLVYGSKAVLPMEIQIPLLRFALVMKMQEEKHKQGLLELETLDVKCLEAQLNIELYQARILKHLIKKVRQKTFKKGNLILALK